MNTYARWMFGLAAAFNGVVGLAVLFARPWLIATLGMAPITGSNIAIANLTGAFIVLFAYAYARVAMDPVHFRPFIGLSAFGKLAAAIGVTLPWLAGAIDARLPALVGGDVVFAALFLDYLRRTRTKA